MTAGGQAAALAPGSGSGMRIAVVASRFNREVTERLVAGASAALAELAVASSVVVWVPGALELPLAALAAVRAARRPPDAVVCLGAVIRGETDHHIHVATQCAAGLRTAQLDAGVPMVFGVLTTDTLADALERAGGKHGNKGAEAAAAAVEMALTLRDLPKEW